MAERPDSAYNGRMDDEGTGVAGIDWSAGPEAARAACEKRIYDLEQLLEISKSLNSTLEYPILIDSILFTIMGQLRVAKAGLFSRKGLESPTFSLYRNFKGFEIDQRIDYSFPEDHEFVRFLARNAGVYRYGELISRVPEAAELPALRALGPDLVVPLKAKGAVNGVILLGERIDSDGFTDYELKELLAIADLAAGAVHNAFLFELTTTDMMTKLKLKHYFYTVLLERMEKAAERDTELAVLMLDIDHFKQFNDTYGHSCGDAVLKQVARTLRESVRPGDLAARYGGEEFCVLLPESDESRAMAVGERVRLAIESARTEYEGLSLQVTVSVGVAQYRPGIDISGRNLIDRADKALYQSKQSGRNRVTAAGAS